MESIDFADVQQAKLDSTLYNSAFEAYALEDLTAANSRFAQYLERFPKGLFIRKVRYYHAVSLEKAGQEDEALIQWEELFQLGAGDHRDIAVFQLGKRAFQDSAYDRSRDFFIQLGPDDDPLKLRESRFYLLRIADLQQDAEAVIGIANTILADEKTLPDQITYALLLRAVPASISIAFLRQRLIFSSSTTIQKVCLQQKQVTIWRASSSWTPNIGVPWKRSMNPWKGLRAFQNGARSACSFWSKILSHSTIRSRQNTLWISSKRTPWVRARWNASLSCVIA